MKSCSSDIDRAVRGLLSWDVPTAQGENPNVGDARAAAEMMAIADFMVVEVLARNELLNGIYIEDRATCCQA